MNLSVPNSLDWFYIISWLLSLSGINNIRQNLMKTLNQLKNVLLCELKKGLCHDIDKYSQINNEKLNCWALHNILSIHYEVFEFFT